MRRKQTASPARTRGLRRPTSSRSARPVRDAASLSDLAYAHLEELIVTLEIPPGTSVSEVALSRKLAIGRTPIREALQRLARERLVSILPRRGIIVSAIDIPAQLRLLEVRRELERLVARSASRRATAEERAQFSELAATFEHAAAAADETGFMRTDRAFNELCLVAARNEFVTGAMSLMNSLSRRFWFVHYRQAADMPLAGKLHAAVAHAIAAGNASAAAKASDALIDYIEAFTRTSEAA